MSNLNKVYDVWKDLEASYGKSGYTSRVKYLEACVGYSEGVNLIDYILERVQEDMDNFTPEEEDKYSEVQGKLLAAQKAFSLANFMDIDNLNDFLKAYSGAAVAHSSFITEMQICEIAKPEPSKMLGTLEEIYDKFGVISNRTFLRDGKVCVASLDDPDAIHMNITRASFAKFLAYKHDMDFLQIARTLARTIQKESGIKGDYLFLKPKYFKITPKRIYITISGFKKFKRRESAIVREVNGHSTYELKCMLSDREYTIVCVQ